MDVATPKDVADTAVSLHPLIFLAEGDEITIGRTDIDSYAIFPPDGAEVVRRLQEGMTPREVGDWYLHEYGESVDVAHIVAALGELGFLRGDTDFEAAANGDSAAVSPVRGQRLGAALFSPPAFICYGAIIVWAIVAMVRSPDVMPTYRSLFFTQYFAVMEVTLIVGVLPLLLGHEAFHVLAARRIGVRSRLGISRRLYFIVLETRLDGLVAVPRRRRYLPILAGVLFDVVVTALLVVVADLTRSPDGTLSFAGRLCVAFAFTTVMRLVWQCYFHLRTDLYVLATIILGCVDLQGTTRKYLVDVFGSLARRGRPRADRSTWHPVDRRIARWWAWCVVAGYTFNIGTLVFAVVPIVARFVVGILDRLTGQSTSAAHLLDASVFLTLTTVQIAVSGWLWIRERRRRTTLRHVIT